MTGGEAVVATLRSAGVDTVFGIPGVHTLPIYDALAREPAIRHIMTRHEQGAGFAADGYARAGGRPGVAIAITGPGLTNISTALGQAYSDSSPVLVISSHNARRWLGRGAGELHELKDQSAMMAAICAHTRRVHRAAEIPAAIAEAWVRMLEGRPRPVHVEIPHDVLAETDDVPLVDIPRPRRAAVPEAALGEAARMLSAAERPLVIAGGGAVEAAASLRLLVERLDAAVLVTHNGKGILPEQGPPVVGGHLRTRVGRPLLEEADVVLAVGTELAPTDVDDDAPLDGKLIHLDIDPANLGRRFTPRLALCGDAAPAVAALAERVQPGPDRSAWRRRVEAACRQAAAEPAGYYDAEPQRALLRALRQALPADGILVNDMTVLSYAAYPAFPALAPRSFLAPTGFGTLGFSLPAAIGAKLACPERAVVAIIGDGGFQFTCAEFGTAVQYRLPIPVVVLNNRRWGVVRDVQVRTYGRAAEVELVNPDFCTWARAYGRPAHRVEDAAALAEHVAAALRADGPTLLEVPVSF